MEIKTKADLDAWKRQQDSHAYTLDGTFHSEGMNAGGPSERSRFRERVDNEYRRVEEELRKSGEA